MAVLDDILGLGQPGASDPLTGLAMILDDIFGDGGQTQRAPALSSAPATRSVAPGQFMLGGPELKTSSVGEVGPSGIPPLMRPPSAQPAQRRAQPSLLPEPSFLDRFAAFAGAPNLGAGIKAATSGMDQQQELARGTYGALVKRGIEPEMAKLIVRDKGMLSKVIPAIFGNAISPQAPKIINLKSTDEFGQETEAPHYWNPKTRKLEPASNLTAGGASEAKMAPVSLSSGQQRVDAQPQTQGAPSLLLAPQQVGGQQYMLPGDLQTENLGQIGGPAAQGEAQTAEVLPVRTEPLGTSSRVQRQTKEPQGRYVFGPPAPEKRLGTGYLQKTDEKGRFLWQRVDGRLMPVVEPKAAIEARAKRIDEQTGAKVKTDKVAEQFRGGIERLMSLPKTLGEDAFDIALGPWQNNDDKFQIGVFGSNVDLAPIGRAVARGLAEFKQDYYGGAEPTEVRERLGATVKNLAAVMKGLVRQPGEGVWTDKDQENLEAQIGKLERSESLGEYYRRVDDIKENVESIFKIAIGKVSQK